MKHLQNFYLFESSTGKTLTIPQMVLLDRITKGIWSFNPSTGLVDVEGSVITNGVSVDPDDRYKRLDNLRGIQFGTVTGDFNCENEDLESLAGAPETVGGTFNCFGNELKNLEGGPKFVKGRYLCGDNPIESMKGAPETVGGSFSLSTGGVIPAGEWGIPTLYRIYSKTKEKQIKDMLKDLVSPEAIQQQIDENPERMAVNLKDVINDMASNPEYKDVKFPDRLQSEVDLLSDLADVGL